VVGTTADADGVGDTARRWVDSEDRSSSAAGNPDRSSRDGESCRCRGKRDCRSHTARVRIDPDDGAIETLENLWLGNVSRIQADDGSSAYTKSELVWTLTALMNSMQPDKIPTQDYLGTFGDGDHDDHHAAAYFATSAHISYALSHKFIGYLDSASADNPQNVFDPDLTAKTNAYSAYLVYDSAPCGAPPECGTNAYSQWLKRQDVRGSDLGEPVTTPRLNDNAAPSTTFANPGPGQAGSGTIEIGTGTRGHGGAGAWFGAIRVESQNVDPVATS
jgi:hypothetical protein